MLAADNRKANINRLEFLVVEPLMGIVFVQLLVLQIVMNFCPRSPSG